jgi:hypothetical protein
MKLEKFHDIILFVSGIIMGAVLVRYGISLGARIVYKTSENLPAFGKDDDEPVSQAHAGGPENYEVENVG